MQHLRSIWRHCLVPLFCGVLLLPVQAQQVPDKLLLSKLASQAALIFSGTVLAVEHVPAATKNGIGTVRVTFRVNEGIRGVRTGERLTILEWDGLWTAGERYRVGESLVMFMHAPSGELGLSSPVGGVLGRVALEARNSARTSSNPRPADQQGIRERRLMGAIRRAALE